MSDLVAGDDSRVFSALSAAGWAPGRRTDAAKQWASILKSAGFTVHELAYRIWEELGELRIKSLPERVPPCSLLVDPVDACIDSLPEARSLNENLGDSFSPLGMWSSQFRSYVGTEGRVVAVTVRTIWELGSTFPEALDYTVNGDGTDRAETVDWL